MRAGISIFAVLALFVAGGSQAEAKSWHGFSAAQKTELRNKTVRQGVHKTVEKRAAATAPGRATLVGATDTVFPHLAIGGFWETEVVILNMGNATVQFDQYFLDQAGNPMQVTVQSIPDGQTVTDDAITGTLLPGERFTFLLTSDSPDVKVGWSFLDYDTTARRLGGYAIFRSFNVPGRPNQEATVPLSAYDDFFFFQTFDNTDGFVTSMAIINPSATLTTDVTTTVLDQEGNVLETKTITLAPGQHKVFETTNEFPASRDKIGTIVFDGSITRLSALGLRFSPGGAFTTIPVLNWLGNFQ